MFETTIIEKSLRTFFLLAIIRWSHADPSSTISELVSSYGSTLSTSSSCGDVLTGPAGVISYKLNENITRDETCIWSIYVEPKAAIQIRLIETGATTSPSFYKIYVYNVKEYFDTLLNPNTKIRWEDRNPHNISGGPLFKIVLRNDFFPVGGFSLFYESIGPITNRTDDDWLPTYKIFNQMGASSGMIEYVKPDTYPKKEIVSLVLHPELGKRIALTIDEFQPFVSITSKALCTGPGTLFVNEIAASNFEFFAASRYRECRQQTF